METIEKIEQAASKIHPAAVTLQVAWVIAVCFAVNTSLETFFSLKPAHAAYTATSLVILTMLGY